MDSKTLRNKFLKFFEKNSHTIIPSAPLVPSDEEQLEGKEKVLFTSAGMQPLIPYLMGKPYPKGNKLADIQKCVRTDDIEEVGDATHHTFFEMMGNWSLGAYWKDEAIEMSFKFLTEELGIPAEKLAVSVFAGDEDALKDEVSANKWKSLGIPEDRIAYLGKEDNWWPTSRRDTITGELKNAFGPCGPDSEMFYWVGQDPVPGKFDPENKDWVEIWNDVFMEFNRKSDGTLEELPQKNVDTGAGLERTLAVINGKDSGYETDLFLPIIEEINKSKNNYSERSKRIIADHLRAAVFLIAAGVKPLSSENRGSVVRNLIVRAYLPENNKKLEREISDKIVKLVIDNYKDSYAELNEKSDFIKEQINNTEEAVDEIIGSGEIDKMKNDFIKLQSTLKFGDAKAGSVSSGQIGYFYHQSKGVPEQIIFGIAEEIWGSNMGDFKEGYEQEFKKHQNVSKVEKGLFKGGLADHSETVTKYHTATHLLHQALRDVLGESVFQKGSNITSERLRFDFSFDRKMTPEEIKKVEDIINERIAQDLTVEQKFVPVEKAYEMNAIGLFNDKYAKEVSIYGIGPDFKLDAEAKDQRIRGEYYSLEFCGGPHVEHTNTIGRIKIIKEEAVSAGTRRIRAELV